MPARPDLENYFNYFTEIEEYFRRRRGTTLLLSTLDWALIETWKDAGVPLEAVLRGIDSTFERYERRPSKSRKINGLAYCAQEVLAAAEQIKEAAVGTGRQSAVPVGFQAEEIAAFLADTSQQIESAKLPDAARAIAQAAARSLRELTADVAVDHRALEALERRLTVIEEKLFAVLLAATPNEELFKLREQADRDIAPFRSKINAPQIEQLHRQYVHKALLERYGVPRLSLFYM